MLGKERFLAFSVWNVDGFIHFFSEKAFWGRWNLCENCGWDSLCGKKCGLTQIELGEIFFCKKNFFSSNLCNALVLNALYVNDLNACYFFLYEL